MVRSRDPPATDNRDGSGDKMMGKVQKCLISCLITCTKYQQSKQSSSRKSSQLDVLFFSGSFLPSALSCPLLPRKACKREIWIVPSETLSRLTGRWNISVGRYCLTPPLLPSHPLYLSTPFPLSLFPSYPPEGPWTRMLSVDLKA